jgi:hypothetical protein
VSPCILGVHGVFGLILDVLYRWVFATASREVSKQINTVPGASFPKDPLKPVKSKFQQFVNFTFA